MTKLQHLRALKNLQESRGVIRRTNTRSIRAGLIEGKINENKNEKKRTDFRFLQKTAG